jgi:hypothetical protein
MDRVGHPNEEAGMAIEASQPVVDPVEITTRTLIQSTSLDAESLMIVRQALEMAE